MSLCCVVATKSQHTLAYKHLPKLLLELRTAAGLTQRELGTKLGKPHSWIYNCEVGNRRVDITEFILWVRACGERPANVLSRIEKLIYLDDQRAARNCLDYFDENFKGGHTRTIDEQWIDKYRSQFTLRLKAMKALQKARDRVLRLRAKRIASKPVPLRIRGYKFGFTGKIEGWPRDTELYPLVQKLGGLIALRAGSIPSADCLVHGQILGGRKSTLKLNSAEENEVPIISDEDFFEIVAREKKRRQRAKGRG